MATQLTPQPHKNNVHNKGYDFSLLVNISPKLKDFIIKNPYNGQPTIDFTSAEAVKALNRALLACHYNIEHWDIPQGYLCPPIPGRVDYIHHLNDLLVQNITAASETKQSEINVLDIGTGASCIYPILGQSVYNWRFVASDIDPLSLKTAQKIIDANQGLSNQIECRLQPAPNTIFKDIIRPNEYYHLTMCNPPFHKSLADAQQGSNRKWKNLKKINAQQNKTLNFGGQKAELWCKGGELAFIQKMITESQAYAKQVLWFTCLVSQKDNIRPIKLALQKAKANRIEVIKMAQGNKVSRFIAWQLTGA